MGRSSQDNVPSPRPGSRRTCSAHGARGVRRPRPTRAPRVSFGSRTPFRLRSVPCPISGSSLFALWILLLVVVLAAGGGLLWAALSPLVDRSGAPGFPQEGVSGGWEEKGAPSVTSKLAVRRPASLLDTTSGSPLGAGSVQSVELPQDVPMSAVGVLLTVEVHDARRQGAARVSGWGEASTHQDARPVLQLTGEGAAVSQLVTLPLNAGDRAVRVIVESGGHLSVQLVGVFQPVSLSAEGRVVAVPSQHLLRLSTLPGTGGRRRSATIRLTEHPVLPETAASAVLLQMSVRPGSQGARVEIEALGGQAQQVLRWGRAVRGQGELGQAMAVVPLAGDGQLSVELLSGQTADVELVGYVTGEQAAWSSSGLVLLADTGLVTAEITGDTTEGVDLSGALPGKGAGALGALVAVSAAGRQPGEVTVFPSHSAQPASPVVGISRGTVWNGMVLLPLEGPRARVWVSGDRAAEVALDVLWTLVGAVPG
jgi:hypothetical protein